MSGRSSIQSQIAAVEALIRILTGAAPKPAGPQQRELLVSQARDAIATLRETIAAAEQGSRERAQ